MISKTVIFHFILFKLGLVSADGSNPISVDGSTVANVESADEKVWGKPTKAEKHAQELDLECATYKDYNWIDIKKDLWEIFDDIHKEHHADPNNPSLETSLTENSSSKEEKQQKEQRKQEKFDKLIKTAKKRPATDCYLGLFALGIFTFLFMEPEQRAVSSVMSRFISVPYPLTIPLTFWDTIAAGWPLFHILDFLSSYLAVDYLESNIRLRNFGYSDPANAEREFEKIVLMTNSRRGVKADDLSTSIMDPLLKEKMLISNDRIDTLKRLMEKFRLYADSGDETQPPVAFALQVLDDHRSDRYARACSYFILAEQVLRSLRARTRVEVVKTLNLQRKEILQNENNNENSILSILQSNRTILTDLKLLIHTVAWRNRRLKHKEEREWFDKIESHLYYNEEGTNDPSDDNYRSLVTEARALLLLAEMSLDWRDDSTVYDRSLINAHFWPLWKLLARIERTGMISKNYSKLLSDKRMGEIEWINKEEKLRSSVSSVSTREESFVSSVSTRKKSSVSTRKKSSTSNLQKVDVALSTDNIQIRGLLAVIESLSRNTVRKDLLNIHILLSEDQVSLFLHTIICSYEELRMVDLRTGKISKVNKHGEIRREIDADNGTSDTTNPESTTTTNPESIKSQILSHDEEDDDAKTTAKQRQDDPKSKKPSILSTEFAISDLQHSVFEIEPFQTVEKEVEEREKTNVKATTGKESQVVLAKVSNPNGRNRTIGSPKIRFHIFDHDDFRISSDDINNSNTGNLSSPHNYIRFMLQKILKNKLVLYLDSDIIVQGDVVQMMNEEFPSDSSSKETKESEYPSKETKESEESKESENPSSRQTQESAIYAVPRPNPISGFLHVWENAEDLERQKLENELYNKKGIDYGREFINRNEILHIPNLKRYMYERMLNQRIIMPWIPGFSSPSFNAGVMVFDLSKFQGEYMIERYLKPRKLKPYREGSQAPLLMHFKKNWKNYKRNRDRNQSNSSRHLPIIISWSHLPFSWNVVGLGYHCGSSLEDQQSCRIEILKRAKDGKILHWTGPNKPWMATSSLDSYVKSSSTVDGEISSKKVQIDYKTFTDGTAPTVASDANQDHDLLAFKFWKPYDIAERCV